MKRLLVLTAAVLALSCGGGSSPTDPLGDIPRGTLNGLVTLAPGPAQPSAYQSRKVQVWDAARTKLLFTVDLDNGGFYSIELTPNTYTIDLKPNGIDKSSDVPKQVVVKQNQTTRFDIAIDTGIH